MDVPPLSVWRDEASNAEVVLTYETAYGRCDAVLLLCHFCDTVLMLVLGIRFMIPHSCSNAL